MTEYATEEEIHNAWLALIHFLLAGDKLNAGIAAQKWLDMQAQKKGEVE
jgi:hypothetical protein